MRLILKPGEKIRVQLEGADGEFTIKFGEKAVTVKADMPGNVIGEAGTIYKERFGGDVHEGLAE